MYKLTLALLCLLLCDNLLFSQLEFYEKTGIDGMLGGTITGNLTINGNITQSAGAYTTSLSTTIINGDGEVTGKLDVNGAVTINSSSTLTGDLGIPGYLNVQTQLNNVATDTTTISTGFWNLTQDERATGNNLLSGTLTVASSTTFNNTMFLAAGTNNNFTIGGSTQIYFSNTSPTSGDKSNYVIFANAATKQASVGQGIPGNATTDDLIISRYNGAWLESLRILNSDGGVVVKSINPSDYHYNYYRTYSDTAARSSILEFFKSHSNTEANTATIDGEALGHIQFHGVDSGSNDDIGAYIYAQQNGAAGTRVPTDLYFKTCTGSAVNDTMILTTAGNVGIGTLTPTATLKVSGTTEITGATDINGTSTFGSSVTVSAVDLGFTGAGMIDVSSTTANAAGIATMTTAPSPAAGLAAPVWINVKINGVLYVMPAWKMSP